MNKNNVDITKKIGLCCSCGICKNVCPKKCIVYKREKGMYIPVINNDSCIHCRICADVCPGIQETYEYNEPLQAVLGTVLKSYNAWSRDSDIRRVSASGGCISTIVTELLQSKKYDVAFMVNTYSYDNQLLMVPIFEIQDIKNSNLPKSRYLPVSHENVVSFMLEHRDKRMILIGTSCALRGLRKVVSRFQLNRDNFLFIGLFCDKVFNYNVYDYLANCYAENKEVSALHFKNKESGGWPGNMKLLFCDGSYTYLDKSIRVGLKDYFVPERCLYCIDKMNVSADIAFGDNYTNQNSSPKGSNSVIIRTRLGEQVWSMISPCLEYEPVSVEEIGNAQYLDDRLNNLNFAQLKMKKLANKDYETLNLFEDVQTDESYEDYAYKYYQTMKESALGANYLERSTQIVFPFKRSQRFSDSIVKLYFRAKRRFLKR